MAWQHTECKKHMYAFRTEVAGPALQHQLARPEAARTLYLCELELMLGTVQKPFAVAIVFGIHLVTCNLWLN